MRFAIETWNIAKGIWERLDGEYMSHLSAENKALDMGLERYRIVRL